MYQINNGDIMGWMDCMKCGCRVHTSKLPINICDECEAQVEEIYDDAIEASRNDDADEDIINWPKHYNTGKIQPIDAIEDWQLDFRLANAVKYIARAGKKNPDKIKEDLEKALWYIKRFIDKEC
jgi:hypothetical protein